MYAFVSHESACEALRALSSEGAGLERVARWPETPQHLPPAGECVSGQRAFKRAGVGEALAWLGVTSRPVDLLVPADGTRSNGERARFHVWGGTLPARSMLRVGDGLFVCGPELVLVQLCSSQSKLDPLLDAHVRAARAERDVVSSSGSNEKGVLDHPLDWERLRRLVVATAVACEFSGSYRLGCGGRPTLFHAPVLMSAESLEQAIASLGTTQGTRRARRVLDLMLENSASPMETALALMLALPPDMGGFGLEKPQLNCTIDVSRHEGALSDRAVVTPDLLWAEQKVALEYDSHEFHGSRGRGRALADAVRSNVLTALGYRVFRATTQTVRSLPELSLLARQVAHALGEELAEATPLQELRRRRLFMLLMPAVRR